MSGLAHDPGDVLLVEDDAGDALMVREYFAQAGRASRFHVTPDGQQALRFLRQAGEYTDAPRPGLILLDLNLPGLHGLEVLARIKADPGLRIIPVVVLSSSRHPDDIQRSYEMNANAYIVKPADLDGFEDMIRQVDACFLHLIEPPPASVTPPPEHAPGLWAQGRPGPESAEPQDPSAGCDRTAGGPLADDLEREPRFVREKESQLFRTDRGATDLAAQRAGGDIQVIGWRARLR
ncbi:MAG: response regulator [Streptosporangiaceae bacterium]